MQGNVLEWCQDVYEPSYYTRPEASGRDPVNDPSEESPSRPKERVLRGGPFDGEPQFCRCADRWWEKPNAPYRNHGLRPVRPIR
jgi:formylglycine-generating enzyme required for sulfatase activity